MSTKHFYLLTISLIWLVCGGCSPENRPADLPPLFPVTLTIMLGDQPLDNALITFYSENEEIAKWTVGSVTDANGKAIIVTHGQFRGSPAGQFKVCVKKVKLEGDDEAGIKKPQNSFVVDFSPSQQPAKMPKMIYIVDPLFGQPEKTPLEIEIPAGKKMTNLTLTVHKPK